MSNIFNGSINASKMILTGDPFNAIPLKEIKHTTVRLTLKEYTERNITKSFVYCSQVVYIKSCS